MIVMSSTHCQRVVVAREVCWNVFRERVGFVHGGVKSVRYELVLTGIHLSGEHPPRPGCDLCKDVYHDLERIASWLHPTEHRRSIYKIEPFHAAIRCTSKRNLRSEVALSIKILRRDHFDAPIDACETSCLAAMENRLRLGWASKRPWVPLERRGIHHDTP